MHEYQQVLFLGIDKLVLLKATQRIFKMSVCTFGEVKYPFLNIGLSYRIALLNAND